MSISKKIAIVGLVFAASLVFWLSAKSWLADPLNFGDYNVWLTPVLLLSFLASVLTLSFMIFEDYYFELLIAAVSGLPIILVFGFNSLFILGFVLVFLFNFLAMKRIGKEADNNLKLRTSHTLRRGLPKVIMPILIAFSFAYFLSPQAQSLARDKELPAAISQAVEKTAEVLTGNQLNDLSPLERQKIQGELATKTLETVRSLYQRYSAFLPPILAFGLFLALKSLSFVFVWLGLLFAYLLFFMLKKIGLIEITEVEAKKEKVIFT